MQAAKGAQFTCFTRATSANIDTCEAAAGARQLVALYMTEEAFVGVKWLYRLVDMVHAGCLPQVQSANTGAFSSTKVQILAGCLSQLVLDTLARSFARLLVQKYKY